MLRAAPSACSSLRAAARPAAAQPRPPRPGPAALLDGRSAPTV